MKRTLTGLYLLLFLFLAGGCRKPSADSRTPLKASQPETTASPLPVTDSQAENTIIEYKSLLGKVFYGEKNGVDLTGLPEKLLYPDATPLSRFGKYYPRFGCSYNLETKDSPAKVFAYYEKVLSEWKLVADTSGENYKSRSYVSAGKKEVVEVNTSQKNGRTVIVLLHTYRIME